MVFTAKVGPKGQAVIPKPLRDKMGIRPGDQVAFTFHDGHLHVEKPSGTDELEAFFNAFPKRNVGLNEFKDAIEEQYEDRARRSGLL